MLAKLAVLVVGASMCACSMLDTEFLMVGLADSGDVGGLDQAASETPADSSASDDISDASSQVSFTFADGPDGWTCEGAWPVGADNIVETWVSAETDATADSSANQDVAVGGDSQAAIVGPALVFTFSCPTPDSYDVGDALEDGAGMNIIFKVSSAQIAAYVGKTIHFRGSYTGRFALYQFFAQDIDSHGFGVGAWAGLGQFGPTSNATSGTIDAVSQAFGGVQDGGDSGAKFGLQVACGNDSGPVTIEINSITLQ